MNDDLKLLHAQLAEVRTDKSKLAAKLGELGAERHTLETVASESADAVTAAELALVDALAADELGEPADIEGAQQRLDAARLQATSGTDSAQRLMVLDALKARFNTEGATLHARGDALLAEIAAAEVEILRAKTVALRDEATAAMLLLARLEYDLPALRALIVERGGVWDFPQLSEAGIGVMYRASGRNATTELLAELAA